MALDPETGQKRQYPPKEPVADDDPRYSDPHRCGHWHKQDGTDFHRRSDGSRCLGWCIKGTKKCKRHSGKSTAVAVAEGRVVAEFSDPVKWGLGSADVDPGEVLLRLVTQSAARCDLYASLLQEAYEASDRLKAAHEAEQIALLEPERRPGFGDDDRDRPEVAARQTARADLERIFAVGGVAALVGHQFGSTKDGDIFATGEAIRGLALLEAAERDRCATFATKAVAAGLAERQVQLAERQAEMVAKALSAAFADMGLSQDQQREAIRRVGGHLRIVGA